MSEAFHLRSLNYVIQLLIVSFERIMFQDQDCELICRKFCRPQFHLLQDFMLWFIHFTPLPKEQQVDRCGGGIPRPEAWWHDVVSVVALQTW